MTASTHAELAAAPAPWRSWTSQEREGFTTAVERHRRAAWRVTLACAVGFSALAIVCAVLMGPLLWCLGGLVADLLNLAVPVPDVLGWAGRRVSDLIDGKLAPGQALGVLALAGAPGFALMLLLARALARVLGDSPLFEGEGIGARAPTAGELAEQRLGNVAREMSIAAGLAAPRVLIVAGGANGAAVGRDGRVVILVGEGLLHALDRAELQGVLGHLVGSVANGDLRAGRRMAVTLGLFAVIARLAGSFADRRALARTLGLWRVFVRPSAANTAELLRALADPFAEAGAGKRDATASAPQASGARLTWREWAVMPLMGPLVIVGFLGGLVSQFLLGPLVALAWRERKYMADATAVRLTRDPDALAGALAKLAREPVDLPAWAAHLAVAGRSAGVSGMLGGMIVSVYPSFERRGRALVRLGASIAPARGGGLHGAPLALIVILLSVAGALLCVAAGLLVVLSTMVSMLFTAMPTALLHALLRWLGH